MRNVREFSRGINWLFGQIAPLLATVSLWRRWNQLFDMKWRDEMGVDSQARVSSPVPNLTLSQELPGIGEGEIVVIRSARRKRNIAAYRQGGAIVVSIPARLSKADERVVVPEMVAKIRAQEAARSVDESVLATRTVNLLMQYAPEMTERPTSVLWRGGMKGRWGSCTSVDGTIRISERLQNVPEYVLDYVLYHEGIHLRFGDHGRDFNLTLARFPRADLAQAYLDGYEAAEHLYSPIPFSGKP